MRDPLCMRFLFSDSFITDFFLKYKRGLSAQKNKKMQSFHKKCIVILRNDPFCRLFFSLEGTLHYFLHYVTCTICRHKVLFAELTGSVAASSFFL